MISDHPVLYKNFISEDERLYLKEYTLHLKEMGELKPNTNGPNRFLKSIRDVNLMSECHKKLYDKIVNILNLENPVIDPLLGCIISCVLPGGFIHKHKDPYLQKFKHISHKRNVRFNVMIERGEDICYDPHIEEKPFKVEKCDAWCFAASKFYHNTPVIVGSEYRIVYQFGFCVDQI